MKQLRNFIVALALTGLTLLRSAWATPEEARQLRDFLHDVIAISASAEGERYPALVETLKKHHQIPIWVVQGKDLKALIAEAGLEGEAAMVLKKVDVPNQLDALLGSDRIVAAITQELGLPAERVQFLSGALKETLANMPASELQKIVDDSLSGADSRVRARAVAQDLAKRVPEAAELTNSGVIERAIDTAFKNQFAAKYGEPFAADLAVSINRELEAMKFSDTPAVQRIISGPGGIKVPGMSPERAQQMIGLMSRYFDNIPVDEKRKIVLEMLTLPPNPQIPEVSSIVVQNLGPGIQKLLQQFGGDLPEVKALLSNVRPFPNAADIVEKSLGRPLSEVFAHFDPEPFASATVGQVHWARLKGTNELVAVKVLRPDVRERFKREIESLYRISDGSEFQHAFVKALEEAIGAELDLRNEGRNIDRAMVIYDRPDRGITVANRIAGIEPTQDVLVLNKAAGVQMSKPGAKNVAAEVRAKALESLVEIWFENGLFGSGETRGFFHSDLHGGNRFILTVADAKLPFLLTLIDLGSTDTLSPEDQRAVLKLGIACAGYDPKLALEALDGTIEIPDAKKEAALKAITAVFKDKRDTTSRMGKVIEALVDLEIPVNRSLLQFNRGRMFLEMAIDEVNQYLPPKKRIDVQKVYAKVAGKSIGRDLVTSRIRMGRENAFSANDLFGDFLRSNGQELLGDLRRRVLDCFRAKVPLLGSGH